MKRPCQMEGCDGRHCRKCGGHVPEEISGDECDACQIDRASVSYAQLLAGLNDKERAAAMALWED